MKSPPSDILTRHTAVLKRAIKLAGSQKKLAKKTGLSQQFISKVIRGERALSSESAIALASATEIPLSEIIPEVVAAVTTELSHYTTPFGETDIYENEMRFHCASGHEWREVWPMPMQIKAFMQRMKIASRCPSCGSAVYLGKPSERAE